MIKFINNCNSSSDNPYCINDNPNCKYLKTYQTTHISQPYPEVMIFDLSWGLEEIDFVELLKVYISIKE